MSLDTDQLIAEVASKYGVVISADDPIIAVVALNDVILDQQAARSEGALIELEKRLFSIKKETADQSREIASTVIGAALDLAKKEIHDETTLASKRVTDEIQRQLKGSLTSQVELGKLQSSNKIAWTITSIAVAALAAMVLLG